MRKDLLAKKYVHLIKEISLLLDNARHASVRAVDVLMTSTYWEIGRRIVEYEQAGEKRAVYGEALISNISKDLTAHLGRGFSRQNLQLMRQFYLAFPSDIICQTVSGKLPVQKSQTLSGKSIPKILPEKLPTFPLSWSHYVKLISIEEQASRSFYEKESLRCGWSVRQLDRQISTQFYERTLLSKNKKSMLEKGQKSRPGEMASLDEQIRDPYVLEFLNLKDEYSEKDLEEALIHHLEDFLMELGGDFAFVGRQKRLRVGQEWYRVDLLFFHRKLKCLVIIDLKLGKFTHADAGQMHLYLNYAKTHWVNEGENPPVGIILCAQKDSSVAKYSLEGLPNKVLATEYKLQLPSEKVLAKEIEKTRKMLENSKP